MNDKVVYFHINPLTNEVFYVGIGKPERAFSKENRNSDWMDIVKQFGYIVDVIEENLSWAEASIKERFYIKKIGRKDLGLGTLVNLTSGGQGGECSEQTKEKISKSNKGKRRTPEQKEKMRNSKLGSKASDETKLKLSKASKGNKRRLGSKASDETKLKMSENRKGKKHKKHKPFSQETKDKISKSLIGNKHGLGYKHTQEAKDKMSLASKNRKK